MIKKYKLFHCDTSSLPMSSFQKIKIFIVNKTNLNQVDFCVSFLQIFYVSEFTSYIFLLLYCAFLFCIEVNRNKTITALYLFKVSVLIQQLIARKCAR